MGKDWRRLLPPHLDLHLEVFVPKKKEIAENITAGSGNLKTHNLRTFGFGVSLNPHQRTSGFHERPGSFLGSYLTCSKQRDHPWPYIFMGCLTITVIYQNQMFAFLIIAIINEIPREGLV
jgi:hypothetical protein